jgi:type IV pilus assembly protein PilX
LHPSTSPSNLRIKPRGVALVIVLLILLAITGLALFSARYATMSERTARNQLDMERARQAAESALRDAERDIRLEDGSARAGAPCSRGIARPVNGGMVQFDASCSAGQCLAADDTYAATNWSTGASAEPWWPEAKGGLWNNVLSTKPNRSSSANCTSFTGGVPLGTFTGAAPISGVAQQPEYLIELIRRESGRKVFFRVTARGFGASEQTQVVMQSYFRPPDIE